MAPDMAHNGPQSGSCSLEANACAGFGSLKLHTDQELRRIGRPMMGQTFGLGFLKHLHKKGVVARVTVHNGSKSGSYNSPTTRRQDLGADRRSHWSVKMEVMFQYVVDTCIKRVRCGQGVNKMLRSCLN